MILNRRYSDKVDSCK